MSCVFFCEHLFCVRVAAGGRFPVILRPLAQTLLCVMECCVGDCRIIANDCCCARTGRDESVNAGAPGNNIFFHYQYQFIVQQYISVCIYIYTHR